MALGDFYNIQEDYKQAENAYLEAKALAPKKLTASKQLAKLYLRQKKTGRGKLIVNEILETAPKDPDGLFYKGRLLFVEGKRDKVGDLFRRVAQLNPRYPEIHYYLALAHLSEGDIQQAKSAFSEAVHQQPKDYRARLALAKLHLKSRTYRLAMEEVRQVLEAQPSNLEAQLLEGDAAIALQDFGRAETSYKKAMKLAPVNPFSYFRLGLLKKAEKKEEEAKKLFETALTYHPDFVKALSQIVSIELSKNRLDSAFKRVENQIDLSPENGGLYRLRARLYASKKENKKAETDYKKAITLNPDDLSAYLDLGQFYGRTKQYQQALQELDAAIQVNANVVQVHMLRGVIYDALGQCKWHWDNGPRVGLVYGAKGTEKEGHRLNSLSGLTTLMEGEGCITWMCMPKFEDSVL